MSSIKKLKKVKYKAVIIGAGRIGAQFDSLKSKEILTHAHAYYKHPKVELMGFFDVNKKAAKKAAKKWDCKAYFNLAEMFKNDKPDIVSICTPDKYHVDNLIKIAEYKPKIVICEKPVTIRLQDTKKIIKIYRKIKVPVLVNYSRRFNKTVQILRSEIAERKYGRILCANGIYTKGILHNGSHMIDLCCYLFGGMKDHQTLYTVADYKKNDKSVAAFINFQYCNQFYLMVGDERKYSVFEVDIFFAKARFRLIDFGFQTIVQKVVSNPRYINYQCLGKLVVEKTQGINAMPALIDNAINHLEKKQPLLGNIIDAVKTQKNCLSLLKDSKIK